MKKLIPLSTVSFLFLFFINSCTEINESKEKDTIAGEKIIFGKIDVAEKNPPLLLKEFTEVNGFIQKYNNLSKKGHTYLYENTWIEVLHNLNKPVEYYLAVGGIEKDSKNQPTGSCYTVYLQLFLDSNNGDLFYSPDGVSHTCTGHCCSSCNLEPVDENHPNAWCKCTIPETTPSCENEARCDHSVAM